MSRKIAIVSLSTQEPRRRRQMNHHGGPGRDCASSSLLLQLLFIRAFRENFHVSFCVAVRFLCFCQQEISTKLLIEFGTIDMHDLYPYMYMYHLPKILYGK